MTALPAARCFPLAPSTGDMERGRDLEGARGTGTDEEADGAVFGACCERELSMEGETREGPLP